MELKIYDKLVNTWGIWGNMLDGDEIMRFPLIDYILQNDLLDITINA